jgi:shikimate dehydrogenase
MMITGKTTLCGLIGDNVIHSLSPAMHNAAFAALDLDYTYLAFRVDSRNIDLALAGLKVLGARGLNVTVPHKTTVLPFLDSMSPEAQKIGAVNTIVNEAGKLTGHNTDITGFYLSLEAAGIDPQGKKVVVLGTGGAARAAAYCLASMGARLTIITRQGSLEKGKYLARTIGGGTSAGEITGLKESLNGAALLVNATSAGMYPRSEETLVPAGLLKPELTVFEVVYAPRETRLLRDAKNAGCAVIEGLEMLVYQGAASFELWTGKKAPLDIMRQAALKSLE